MIIHTGPNRSIVLAVYVVLVLAALVVIGSRVVPPGHAPDPRGTHSPTAEVDAR